MVDPTITLLVLKYAMQTLLHAVMSTNKGRHHKALPGIAAIDQIVTLVDSNWNHFTEEERAHFIGIVRWGHIEHERLKSFPWYKRLVAVPKFNHQAHKRHTEVLRAENQETSQAARARSFVRGGGPIALEPTMPAWDERARAPDNGGSIVITYGDETVQWTVHTRFDVHVRAEPAAVGLAIDADTLTISVTQRNTSETTSLSDYTFGSSDAFVFDETVPSAPAGRHFFMEPLQEEVENEDPRSGHHIETVPATNNAQPTSSSPHTDQTDGMATSTNAHPQAHSSMTAPVHPVHGDSLDILRTFVNVLRILLNNSTRGRRTGNERQILVDKLLKHATRILDLLTEGQQR
ncbi:hypothetical protein K488DRAFT_73290 [Vararia minispora EC-137]|uniref:Uncharacterized protein n=1 Tax=Vararia minispora EC-137 TaxID=1314806 RepID=A0ACB8QB36_9AGAM|nr:hypothetical protein K488DRAFT_73290 [Vararia minispora EC-137]